METTSVKVYEIRNSTYEIRGGQELIFKIPKNINLINQKETFLKFNLRLGAKDESLFNAVADATPSQKIKYCLDRDIGAEALIKTLTIMTFDESQTLSQINNYNRIAKLAATYGDNTTKKNIKNLYEGRGNQLLLGPKNQLWELDNFDGAGTKQETNTLKYRTIEVCIPLRHSGILGGNDLFPNMLTGLCVKIQLEENPFKVLIAQGQVMLKDVSPLNTSNDNINRVGGYTDGTGYGCVNAAGDSFTGGNTADTNELYLIQAGQAHNELQGGVLGTGVLTGAVPTAGDNLGTVCLPFTVGGEVNVRFQNGGGVQNQVRTVNAIEFTAGVCKLTLDASVDFTASGGNTENFPEVRIKQPDEEPNLTLSDVELIVGAVIPNEKERNAYLSMVNRGGYTYNYYSIQNYPVNNSSGSTVISNLINCKLSKAKSILSTFEDLEHVPTAVDDGLSCPIKSNFQPSNYHYIIDNLKTPSRNVELGNLNNNPTQEGSWNCVHIKEIIDGFRQCNKNVETLEPLKENFVIARGLSRYNHTYNFLQQRGETRLNMEFVLNDSPTLNHNFVYHWKQLVVSPQGVEVIV